jgi:glycosyltransferase involved in cell wall biosynthesis
MMADGLTTIVIPCYNQADYLAEAIRSALAQDSAEVIVVDDGSTDASGSAAARFPGVRLLRQTNQGVAAARNSGARAARGEFVLFLDADDRLRPEAIARLRAALGGVPEAAFAYGRFEGIDRNGQRRTAPAPPRRPGTPYESLLESNFICSPATVLYRRAAFVETGGFPPGADQAADYAMYLQLARSSPVVAVDAVVAEYRLHEDSMSARADRMLVATLRAHGRERRTANTPALRRRWAAGRAHWRAWYGSRLVDQIRAEWKSRRFRPLVRDVAVLSRYAPLVMLAHARKKAALFIAAHLTRYSADRPSV